MTTYYVATNGLDSNDGLTIGTPVLTLQKACGLASATDTIQMRGGVYAEGARVVKALTIMAYPGEAPLLTSSTSTAPLIGGEKWAVIEVAAAGVIIDGLTIRNYTPIAQGCGIYLAGVTSTPSLTVRNCTIYGNRYYGIRTYNAHGLIAYNNSIYDNYVGISIEAPAGVNEGLMGRGTQIYNNAIYGNIRMVINDPTGVNNDYGAMGILLNYVSGISGTPIKIYNNTIYGNHAWSYDYGYDGSAIEVFASAYVDIYDNTIHDNPSQVETGTTQNYLDSARIPVSNIRFYRNLWYRGTQVPTYDWRPTGTQFKTAVQVATTAAKTFATGFANGQTVDGQTLVTGQRILIKDQTTGSQNGIWLVPASGSPVTRATDADSGAELLVAACFVTAGTANNGTIWYCSTPATIVPNTTALTFVKITPYVSQFAATGFCTGMFLGAGDNMVIVKNTFIGFDARAVFINTTYPTALYAGTTANFVFEDNIVVTSATSGVGILVWRPLTGSPIIDYNFYQAGVGGAGFMTFANLSDLTLGTWTTVAQIQSNTPFEDHALSGDPLFIAPGTDYRLQTTSTGVNAGTVLAPFTDGYLGPLPDMGYYDTTTGTPPQVPGGAHRFGGRNQIR